MDDDRRDLVRHVLAIATAMLEDTSALAASGQAYGVAPDRLAQIASDVAAAARDVAALAEAARVLAEQELQSAGDEAEAG